MNFLHYYHPTSIIVSIGPITTHWYGIFMALALAAGLLVSLHIAKWYNVGKEAVCDLFFYLVIFGFLGARIFYILYNPAYFWQHPLDIVKIWQGGIAIHGALVFGALTVWWFAKKHRADVWKLAAIFTPGIALGQAIGRWGNYFNQEVFGRPTNLPWGIPIDAINRPPGFENFQFFHPTFLYESIGNLIIFGVLLWLHYIFIKKLQKQIPVSYQLFAVSYLLLYSALRFCTELLRIDPTAGSVYGVRATMVLSAIGIIIALYSLLYITYKKSHSPQTS
jgi:phosphatidylglycerol:prolipoprotein diacylglycerol transferase